MNATFRVRREYRWMWWKLLLFFSAMSLLVVVACSFDPPPPDEWPLAVGVGGGWLAFTALCTWFVLACHRHRLVISGEQIESVGVLRRKTLRLPEITSVKWGGPVLTSPTMKIAIDVGDYEPEERRQIIRFIRESIPPHLQTGWDPFYVRSVKREFNSVRERQKTAPGQGEVLYTRRRFDWYLLIFLPLFIAVAAYSWRVTGEARHWIVVPAALAVWAYFRFRFPRKGIVEKRMSAEPEGRAMVWFLIAGFAGMPCYFAVRQLLPGAETPFLVIYFVPLFTWFFVKTSRVERDRRRKEQEAADAERASGRLVPEELLTPWTS